MTADQEYEVVPLMDSASETDAHDSNSDVTPYTDNPSPATSVPVIQEKSDGSVTVSSPTSTIYTPSSSSVSAAGSEDHDGTVILEEASLTSPSPPPEYRPSPSTVEVGIEKGKVEGDRPENECQSRTRCFYQQCANRWGWARGYRPLPVGDGDGDDENENQPTRRKRRFCCGKRRERRKGTRRFWFVFIKLVLVLFLGSWILAKFVKYGKTKVIVDQFYDPELYKPGADREVVIDRTSHSIWGRYPLYDLLSLTTTSGSVAVTIDPQPADPANPNKPARVVIHTQSGSVAISFALPLSASLPELDRKSDAVMLTEARRNKKKERQGRRGRGKKKNCAEKEKHKGQDKDGDAMGQESARLSQLLARPYEIEVRSQSGSISGRAMFSTVATFSTMSGSINLHVVPVVVSGAGASTVYESESGSVVRFTTYTTSGSTQLQLTEPFFVATGADPNPAASPPRAISSHTSGASGSLNIKYPTSWAGTVEASSRGGGICLNGRGLEVHSAGEGYVEGAKKPSEDGKGPQWWGGAGDMDTTLSAAGSGSVNFWVGR